MAFESLPRFPRSLTPAGFLEGLTARLPSCSLLSPQERGFLQRRIEIAQDQNIISGSQALLGEAWYLLAHHFLAQIPGPVDVQMYDAQNISTELAEALPTGGYPMTPAVVPTNDVYFEVRCNAQDFDSIPHRLPRSTNWEIGLWQIEQGFARGQKLVDSRNISQPRSDRRMAFRLFSPTFLAEEIAADRKERSLALVPMLDPATFRDYEMLLANRLWPLGLPLSYANVDDEGPQHPIYFSSHDLSHLGLRSQRSRSLQDLAHLILLAGVDVYPDVDGETKDAEIQRMRWLLGKMIDLQDVYFIDHLAKKVRNWIQTKDESILTSKEEVRRNEFLGHSHDLVLEWGRSHGGEAAPVVEALDRGMRNR